MNKIAIIVDSIATPPPCRALDVGQDGRRVAAGDV